MLAKKGQQKVPSPIQTVTVGSGISPDQPLLRLAGYDRRWGITPRPEGNLHI